MFGWLIVVFVLAAVAAPQRSEHGGPRRVGLGVVVTPADGWYSAADVWDVGADAVALQKSGSCTWPSRPSEYAGHQRRVARRAAGRCSSQDFESFACCPPSATMVAGDVPGLVAALHRRHRLRRPWKENGRRCHSAASASSCWPRRPGQLGPGAERPRRDARDAGGAAMNGMPRTMSRCGCRASRRSGCS